MFDDKTLKKVCVAIMMTDLPLVTRVEAVLLLATANKMLKG